MAQSIDERFEIWWKEESKNYPVGLYGSSQHYEIKCVARKAFVFAITYCGRIAEAFWNTNRFRGAGQESLEIWQTILGNNPNPEIKVGDLK